jgi:uncharacterized protein with NAD-binding domain and iron-sulfur cluster
MKKKVIIIGGGIAGLSVAHFLCKYSNLDIHIYESEFDIGGQARSMFGKYCYIEYSWRIFGTTYHNLNKIIDEIKANDNFTYLSEPCIINTNNNVEYGNLSTYNLGKIIFKNSNFDLINKIMNILTISRERALNNYQNITAYNYFNKNPIIQSILGPFLGLDANKVSLSGYYQNLLSVVDNKKYHFTPKNTRITKYPTQESLFVPWVNYLKKNGVKIFTNSKLTDIIINSNGLIDSVIINGKNIKSDEYVFSLSLENINKIISRQPYFSNTQIKNSLLKLENGLQLYYTINLYFSIKLDNNIKLKCNQLVLVDTPWKLIIQRKHTWTHKFMKNCKNTNIQINDVFNVGFLDHNKGLLFGKILSQCSREEAIQEGIYQFKNSKYIKNLINQHDTTFNNIFISYEDWYEFKNNQNGKLTSTNPKFSINTGLMKHMPSNQPSELPKNMFLAGYYVNSTMGGVSMEASCETGLNAGLAIVKKHNYKVIEYPYQHIVNGFPLTIGLSYIDKLFYKLNIKPLYTIIPSTILIILYLLLLITLIISVFVYLLLILYKYKKL